MLLVQDPFLSTALEGSKPMGFCQTVARDRRAEDRISTVSASRRESCRPPTVSVPRLIDVVVWMRAHGRAPHDASSCALGCDISTFDVGGALTI